VREILVLKGPHDRLYLLDAIAERWAATGDRVTVHHGYENLPAADIVILHVDMTRVPPRYAEQLKSFPVVLNRNVLDISKSVFSKLMVTQDCSYDGPVIVKTDNNFGGKPEARVRRMSNRFKWPRTFRRSGTNWSKTAQLDPQSYPIFANKSQVPLGAWKNPNLIVQQFLPEVEDNIYYTRYWMFLGDRGWASRFGSEQPIVKFKNRITPEERINIPQELVEMRREFGFDYGRFDFVIHNNEVIVFDINKTVGGYNNCAAYASELDTLAEGLDAFSI